MWKYINSSELYHAWPKGYKKGPDGKPVGYVSKDDLSNNKKIKTVSKNATKNTYNNIITINSEKEKSDNEKKIEKEKLDKEKIDKKKNKLGLEMQEIKNKQEQQKLESAEQDFEDRKSKEAYVNDLNKYSNASNNFGTAGARLGAAGDTVSKIRVQEKENLDLSQFSSEELRKRIDRNRLEQEYNDRFAPETRVAKGKRIVGNILYGTSALSNLAGSVASIIGAIKSFKNLADFKK